MIPPACSRIALRCSRSVLSAPLTIAPELNGGFYVPPTILCEVSARWPWSLQRALFKQIKNTIGQFHSTPSWAVRGVKRAAHTRSYTPIRDCIAGEGVHANDIPFYKRVLSGGLARPSAPLFTRVCSTTILG